jgi:NAD(P)-dependent dehydrogenase (short-subunit alcohol dehydrogenase family)
MTTVLVTGATDGLGRVVAHDLVERGFDVLVHGRSPERASAVAEEIGAAGVHVAGFSVLDEVRALAEALPHVDVLVNNAGLISEERIVTGDGIELTFQVNHLAPFLLTTRLLERDPPRRVVHVASAGQERPDFGDLMLEHGYDEWRAYRQSKLAQIMFTFDLAAELDGSGVTATALHPGTFMATKMVTDEGIAPVTPLEHGVEATWRLIADPALDGVTGVYFDQTRQARPEGQALDTDDRRALRELSERLTGV